MNLLVSICRRPLKFFSRRHDVADTRLHFIFPDNKERVVTVSQDLRIQPSDEVIKEIQSLLGEDAIIFE